ncbi:hypothetical protein NB640_02805 [Oxalobacter vibrioformis]|uniref:Uncharacterized protein n=1 Tax=Oxalobacter vibrioformis TaxID=933080 RepID=A0A9E9LXP1_9BURK|nr:hypothetical protein [Oxalobacter vibrioformis]WAW10607.1 hypothetical protein NB640_02805 [Oxalobacter vibrioformis]
MSIGLFSSLAHFRDAVGVGKKQVDQKNGQVICLFGVFFGYGGVITMHCVIAELPQVMRPVRKRLCGFHIRKNRIDEVVQVFSIGGVSKFSLARAFENTAAADHGISRSIQYVHKVGDFLIQITWDVVSIGALYSGFWEAGNNSVNPVNNQSGFVRPNCASGLSFPSAKKHFIRSESIQKKRVVIKILTDCLSLKAFIWPQRHHAWLVADAAGNKYPNIFSIFPRGNAVYSLDWHRFYSCMKNALISSRGVAVGAGLSTKCVQEHI